MEGGRNPFETPTKEEVPSSTLFQRQQGNLTMGQYMASKIKKLRAQNEGIKRTSRIFQGIAIYVNGHTEPNKEVLRTLILQHGGQFEAYMTHRVTHMIAEHVADSKLRELMKMKKPLPVVHPKWIQICIESNKRCPIHPYVYSRFHDPLQQTFPIIPIESNITTTSTMATTEGNIQMTSPTIINTGITSSNDAVELTLDSKSTLLQPTTKRKHNLITGDDGIPSKPAIECGEMIQRESNPSEHVEMEKTKSVGNCISHSESSNTMPSSSCSDSHENKSSSYASEAKESMISLDTTTTVTMAKGPPTNAKKVVKLFGQRSTSLNFGQYMASKIQKLRHENDGIKRKSNLLEGIVIYVNGRTQPTKEVLRQLILKHGGGFEHYLTPKVTHMIATQISHSKLSELQSKKKPLPVVSPTWIEECIRQNKKLSVHAYLISRTQSGATSSIFSSKDSPMQEDNDKVEMRSSAPKQSTPDKVNHSCYETKNCQDIAVELPVPEESTVSTVSPCSQVTLPLTDPFTQLISCQTTILSSQEMSNTRLNIPSPSSSQSTMILSPPTTPTQELSPKRSQEECVCTSLTQEIEEGTIAFNRPTECGKNAPEEFECHNTKRQSIVANEVNSTFQEHSVEIPFDDSNTTELQDMDMMELNDGDIDLHEEEDQVHTIQEMKQPTRSIKSTRDGPAAFVRSFLSNSRLHHIGSWKSFYQQHADEFMKESCGSVQDYIYGTCQVDDRIIMHVDMDCFFVSVAIRSLPSVNQTLPVAVAHSGYSSHTNGNKSNESDRNIRKGTSEISSCNYIAREKGLKAGMTMEKAKSLCSNLIVLPYDFEAIEKVSCDVYKIFFKYTPAVQAMSCDEAYLEFQRGTDGYEMGRKIRKCIYDATKCTASVGISHNKLLARLATKKAKPNNLFIITKENMLDHVTSLSVRELPGVGYATQAKLAALGIESCGDLQKFGEKSLREHLGVKTSQTLYQYAFGKDSRALELAPVAKSVCVDINYGVRLADQKEAIEFIQAIATEIHSRLTKGGFLCESVTLKLKVRHPDHPIEPSKYMGHGITNDCSKSIRLSCPTDDISTITQSSLSLWKVLRVVPSELRGAGIHATRLSRKNSINESVQLMEPKSAAIQPILQTRAPLPPVPVSQAATSSLPKRKPKHRVEFPTWSQIDPEVLDTLPEDIQREILHHAAKPSVPTSYSQIDQEVLNALPKSMRQEIQQQFPKKVHLKPSVKSKKGKNHGIMPRHPSTISAPHIGMNPSHTVASESYIVQTHEEEIAQNSTEEMSSQDLIANLLDKIENYGLADVVPILRQLKRRSIDHGRFNEILELCNLRALDVHGYRLSTSVIAPF